MKINVILFPQTTELWKLLYSGPQGKRSMTNPPEKRPIWPSNIPIGGPGTDFYKIIAVPS